MPLKGSYPAALPHAKQKRMVAIDFMGYAKKVPVKKQKFKTFLDLFKSLWSTFKNILATCSQMDIVLDLYRESSIKLHERDRRSKVKGIATDIYQLDQPLPVKMHKFWPLSKNKVSFQRIFIKWVKECQKNDSCTIFFGGAHENGSNTVERLPPCSHEAADNRVMFHVNHAVKVSKYHIVAVASPDTDVFVCAMHHFKQLMFFDLNDFWLISGQSDSTTAVPIKNSLVDHTNADVVDILPLAHALTGCDTTSKVGTKPAALKTGTECGYEILCFFGKTELTDEIISNAEKFLLKGISDQNLDKVDVSLILKSFILQAAI